jgi:NADH:ubiquinone oxidoreductase subunit 5 (subunit L)/multisubunit Na+/H+ antiporter MnhA subunit
MGEYGKELSGNMKSMRLLIWITQLGISTAAPLAGFLLASVWLYKRFELGVWIVILGAVLGIICAIDGLRMSLKAMECMTKDKQTPPPVAFNDHE